MADLRLLPLCTVDSIPTAPTVVGKGAGVIQEEHLVLEASTVGQRLSGTMRGKANFDWMTAPAGDGILRVRAVTETDDGASINVRYEGRGDIGKGSDRAVGYAAPVFSTISLNYVWLNFLQAVGGGSLEGRCIHWDWCQLAEAS